MNSSPEVILYLPFYTPQDEARAAELRACLAKNLNNPKIARVVLLQDDDTPHSSTNNKLSIVRLHHRPTYLDWVQHARSCYPDSITVLANSDIYFDDSLSQISSIFTQDPQAFIALSRYDHIAGNLVAHPNPHWSQDTWAFGPQANIDENMQREIDIPLGVPRCDNKIAYLFSLNGFTIYNPISEIRSIHLHETGLRYYDKQGDSRIKGGMAMVHASQGLLEPAEIDIEVWSKSSTQYNPTPKINRSLEKWHAERLAESARSKAIFGYDRDWQYPAITEQHAFTKMHELLPERGGLAPDTAYVGYPWATRIDLETHGRHRKEKLETLKAALSPLKQAASAFSKRVTVCQHIRLEQYIHLFSEMGITDIYWSHCRIGQRYFPQAPEIKLHPFPLFPVQQVPITHQTRHRKRDILFSFVGAKSTPIYMTQSRSEIISLLQDHPAGNIIDRDTWHFNKVVYDHQIIDRASQPDNLIDDAATDMFKQILQRSTFTLCPSGTGPNSIRLWEAMLNGSIPVVLSDLYAPPGNDSLWATAVVQCEETPEAIASLPERLSAIAEDKESLHRKRVALSVLSHRYGPSTFVHDVLANHGANTTE